MSGLTHGLYNYKSDWLEIVRVGSCYSSTSTRYLLLYKSSILCKKSTQPQHNDLSIVTGKVTTINYVHVRHVPTLAQGWYPEQKMFTQ